MILQAVIVTGVALIFVFIPGTNGVFNTILTMAVVLYCIVYIMILLSGIIFRRRHPRDSHAFKIPGGMPGMWIFSIVGFIGIAFVIFTSFIPPASLRADASSASGYILFILIGSVVLTAVPLLIYKFRKKEWRDPAKAEREQL